MLWRTVVIVELRKKGDKICFKFTCSDICVLFLYLTHTVFSSRRMADLRLSDALNDSVSPPVEENIVQRDFVATLEAETFEDKVGETVGKTDYIPLLDDDEKGKLQAQLGLGGKRFCQNIHM